MIYLEKETPNSWKGRSEDSVIEIEYQGDAKDLVLLNASAKIPSHRRSAYNNCETYKDYIKQKIKIYQVASSGSREYTAGVKRFESLDKFIDGYLDNAKKAAGSCIKALDKVQKIEDEDTMIEVSAKLGKRDKTITEEKLHRLNCAKANLINNRTMLEAERNKQLKDINQTIEKLRKDLL